MSFNIDYRKLKLKNGKTIEQQLKFEAQRFTNILQMHIDDWYNSYSPAMYQRTYAMRNSIFADDMVSIDTSSGNLKVTVKYTDEVFHDSLFGDGSVNALYLMDSGYQVKNGWHKDILYFGYRSGGGFLQKAVDEFNQENYFGVSVELIYPDTIYR